MARARNNLTDAAVRIGSVVGRAEGTAQRTANKAAKAVKLAKVELNALSKQVDALKRQLAKSTKRLKTALK